MDTIDHLDWQDQDLQRWFVPLLLTGICVGIGIAFKCTGLCFPSGWDSSTSTTTSKTLSDSMKRLIPTGTGAQVWWSLFHHSKKDTNTKRQEGNGSLVHRSMSSIGRFALRSQTKRNPSIITFFVALSNEKGQKEIDFEEFAQLVRDRVMPNHERFHSRICPDDDRYFEVMEGKGMRNFISNPPHPTVHNTELFSRIHDYHTSKLNVNERLWEVQISSGKMGSSGAIRKEQANQLEATHDRETLALFRVHHALCDGVSLSVMVGDLCDEGDDLDASMSKLLKERKEKARGRTIMEKLVHFFQQLLFWVVGSIYALSLQAWRTIVSVNPFEQVMAARGDEDNSRTTTWRYVASVDEIKQVAKKLSKRATVNDMMVACVTGALYRQLAEHEKVLKAFGISLKIPKNLNIVIPVHLQGGALLRSQSLGNKIGAYVTAIPARGKQSPGTWLKNVSRRLMEGKTTPAALIAWWLAKLASDFAPLSVAKWALRSCNGHACAVVTNVRGFPFTTHWNGRRIEQISAFLPIPPTIPIGIGVSSYDGGMSFTVEAETRAVPDAEKFADWMIEEYEMLKTIAMEDD